MGQAAMLSEREQHGSGVAVRNTSFEKLQELTRHGYVPDREALPDSRGILLRHRNAPDLILHADGTVDVPLGQPVKGIALPATKVRKTRRWGRAFLIFTSLAIYSIFSFVVILAITE